MKSIIEFIMKFILKLLVSPQMVNHYPEVVFALITLAVWGIYFYGKKRVSMLVTAIIFTILFLLVLFD